MEEQTVENEVEAPAETTAEVGAHTEISENPSVMTQNEVLISNIEVRDPQLVVTHDREESLNILCQNDPSTNQMDPSVILIRQSDTTHQLLPVQQCNSECLNQVNNGNTEHERQSNLSPRRSNRNERLRRWQPWRLNQPLGSSPEQINVQVIPIRGSLRNNGPLRLDYCANIPQERGAPPSYTSAMSTTCPYDLHCKSFIAPMPPPSYQQAVGPNEVDITPETVFELEVTTFWDHRQQTAYCLVCRVMITTEVMHKLSRFTHMSALILFLIGCWPCCLIPYCFTYFKTTYHYCPTCQTLLGVCSVFNEE